MPPGPPVIATLLAEIYGPDAETRRAVATEVREIFDSVPFIVDDDDSFGDRRRRACASSIDQDNLEFHKVEERDVYDTISAYYGGMPGRLFAPGRRPPPDRDRRAAAEVRTASIDERALTTPVPANALPGERGIVELGDVVQRQARDMRPSRSSATTAAPPKWSWPNWPAPTRRRSTACSPSPTRSTQQGLGQPAQARDRLHGQPDDESKPILLWDGEWEVTYVTFRDMGAAFGVALLGIYILVVAQFGSFKLPLVILTPVPLTLIGIMLGHWLFARAVLGHVDDRLHRARRHHRAQLDPAGRFHPPRADGRAHLRDVLLEAGAIRFKPILLTALAAMIGAAVILSDPIFQGLAISLLFGLASSTLLTVLVIPAIYRVLAHMTGEPMPQQPERRRLKWHMSSYSAPDLAAPSWPTS